MSDLLDAYLHYFPAWRLSEEQKTVTVTFFVGGVKVRIGGVFLTTPRHTSLLPCFGTTAAVGG